MTVDDSSPIQVHPASAFKAVLTTATTILNNVGPPYTRDKFDNALFDLASEYSAATGTFTAKNAGIYLITCSLFYTPIASTPAQASAVILVNGSATTTESTDLVGGAGGNSKPEVTSIQNLAAGDAVTCASYQNTGGSQPLIIFNHYNSFSAARLY